MTEYLEEGKSETSADIFQDLLIGHQLGILRVASGTSRAIFQKMNRKEDSFSANVFKALMELGEINAARYITEQPEIERAIKTLSAERQESWKESKSLLLEGMLALLLFEANWQNKSLKKVLPVTTPLELSSATAERIVRRLPIRGKTLDDWHSLLSQSDVRQVEETIRLGLRESASTQQIVDRIRGTAASSFSDGISARLRDKINGIVETASVELTQDVRERAWQKNKKHISGVVWTSVLDSRTSEICRGLDGRVAPLFGMEDTLDPGLPRLQPPDKRPPAHFKCRSIVTAVIDGKVPRQTSYEEWLSKQSEEIQKDILGPRRFNMLQNNTLSFSQLFSSFSGRPLSLAELSSREAV